MMLGPTTVIATRQTYPADVTAIRSSTSRLLVAGALASIPLCSVMKPFVKDEFRMAAHHVILQFADEFITVPAIELLRALIERRDEKKKMAVRAEVQLSKIQELRSDALTLRLRTDSHRSDVRRSRESVGHEQDETERRNFLTVLIPRDEDLGT